MLRQSVLRTLGVAILVAWAACAAPAFLTGEVRAETAKVEPLDVPRDMGPQPEAHADMPAAARIERGLESRRERGFPQQPVLAWSLLQEAARSSNPALAAQALEVAPDTPMIVFEGMRQGADGADPLAFIRSFGGNLPALLWLAGVLAVAAVFGICGAASIGSIAGGARSLGLHGHALSHLLKVEALPSWTGPLALVAVLAAVPLIGLGVVACSAVLGVLAIARGSRAQAGFLVVLWVLAGVALGPGLDVAARLLTQPLAQPSLTAAWRMDRSEPLPHDVSHLKASAEPALGPAVAPAEGRAEATSSTAEAPDAFATYAYGNALKRMGRLDQAERVLKARPAADRLLESRSSNLIGILHLARGDVPSALSEFERARAVGESATILYNLSQTYARNVDLLKRESLYAAARDLDPELVSGYAALDGANVHRYVIQEPLPQSFYLGKALEHTSQARALALAIRSSALGPYLPKWSWLLLPLLAAIGWAVRRDDLARCRRCDRPVCRTCSTPSAAGKACARCERLFSSRARIDANVRKQQTELDRRQQQRLRWIRCAWTLSFPGVGSWLYANASTGAIRIVVGALALGLVVGALLVPVPFEVGAAWHLPLVSALGLLGVLAMIELAGVRRELLRRGKS